MNLFSRVIAKIEHIVSSPRPNLWRTLWINFRCLSFRQAIYLPIRIYGKVKFACLNGTFVIPKGSKLIIGKNTAGFFNAPFGRLCLSEGSILEVGQNCRISLGANICLGKNAMFKMGDYSTLGINSRVICYYKIIVGAHSGITWDTQITDFGSHIMQSEDGQYLPIIKEIAIGDYCWIGNRTTIMPGTKLPNRTIVGSNSLLNKDYTKTIEPFSIIGGIPAKLVKTGVRRIYDGKLENEIMRSQIQDIHKR